MSFVHSFATLFMAVLRIVLPDAWFWGGPWILTLYNAAVLCCCCLLDFLGFCYCLITSYTAGCHTLKIKYENKTERKKRYNIWTSASCPQCDIPGSIMPFITDIANRLQALSGVGASGLVGNGVE
jgi:hypothetical protein